MAVVTPSLADLRSSVDDTLSGFLGQRRTALPEAVPMIDAIEALIAAGGKRLRPAFCYWGYRVAGGSKGPEIVCAAASLELLHSFALVHDDIMDGARERRGQPAVHERLGVPTAILVGDLALVLADELFLRSGFDEVALHRAFEAYSRMRQQVIAGQFLDIQYSKNLDVTEAEARKLAVLKSGLYSVEEPLLIGALLADASSEMLRALSDFGRPLGEAFQLRDDLLGTFGEPSSTGKPADSDIREGKRNLLLAKAAQLLEEPDRAVFLSRWGAGAALEELEIEGVRRMIEACGARSYAEALLDDLTRGAAEALAAMAVAPDARAALEELAAQAANRPAAVSGDDSRS